MTEMTQRQDVSAPHSSGAAPTASTTGNTALRYSGFWVRWAAAMIDGWVTTIVTYVIFIPFGFSMGIMGSATGNEEAFSIGTAIVTMLLSFLLVLGYYVLMTYYYGATLGKMAVGARVCAEDGSRLSFGTVVLREFVGKLVSGILLYAGYLMVAFTDRKRALHDMMAHSVVVYTDPQRGPRKVVVGIVYAVTVGFMTFVIIGVMLIVAAGAIFGAAAQKSSTPTSSVFDENNMVISGEDVADELDVNLPSDLGTYAH